MIILVKSKFAESSRMAKAWQLASLDLGFYFETPFEMKSDNTICWVAGWIADFGASKGTIICGSEAHDDAYDIADALGYYTSGLNPICYETYNRELIIETLLDWGWTNISKQPPLWYVQGCNKNA